MLILEYISTNHVTIYWPSEDCDGQVILTLHVSVVQVILFPYFDHCGRVTRVVISKTGKYHDLQKVEPTLLVLIAKNWNFVN